MITTQGAFYLYDSQDFRQIIKGKGGSFYRLVGDPRVSRFFLAGSDGILDVTLDQDLQLQSIFYIENIPCFSVAISPNGRYLAYATANPDSDATVIISLEESRRRLLMAVTREEADGSRKLTIGSLIVIVNLLTENIVMKIDAEYYDVHGLAWSPNSTELAWHVGDGVNIYNMNSNKHSQLLGELNYIPVIGLLDLVWSPDGKFLAGGGSALTIWNIDSQQPQQLKGHTETIWSIDWSPDGRYLATASSDQTVRIWDARSGKLLKAFRSHTDEVWGVAWSPDGSKLASAGWDGKVNIWELTP